MQPVDVDTIILVASDGVDTEYNTRTHPGMSAYLVSGSRPGEDTIWITIPVNRRNDEPAGAR